MSKVIRNEAMSKKHHLEQIQNDIKIRETSLNLKPGNLIQFCGDIGIHWGYTDETRPQAVITDMNMEESVKIDFEEDILRVGRINFKTIIRDIRLLGEHSRDNLLSVSYNREKIKLLGNFTPKITKNSLQVVEPEKKYLTTVGNVLDIWITHEVGVVVKELLRENKSTLGVSQMIGKLEKFRDECEEEGILNTSYEIKLEETLEETLERVEKLINSDDRSIEYNISELNHENQNIEPASTKDTKPKYEFKPIEDIKLIEDIKPKYKFKPMEDIKPVLTEDIKSALTENTKPIEEFKPINKFKPMEYTNLDVEKIRDMKLKEEKVNAGIERLLEIGNRSSETIQESNETIQESNETIQENDRFDRTVQESDRLLGEHKNYSGGFEIEFYDNLMDEVGEQEFIDAGEDVDITHILEDIREHQTIGSSNEEVEDKQVSNNVEDTLSNDTTSPIKNMDEIEVDIEPYSKLTMQNCLNSMFGSANNQPCVVNIVETQEEFLNGSKIKKNYRDYRITEEDITQERMQQSSVCNLEFPSIPETTEIKKAVNKYMGKLLITPGNSRVKFNTEEGFTSDRMNNCLSLFMNEGYLAVNQSELTGFNILLPNNVMINTVGDKTIYDLETIADIEIMAIDQIKTFLSIPQIKEISSAYPKKLKQNMIEYFAKQRKIKVGTVIKTNNKTKYVITDSTITKTGFQVSLIKMDTNNTTRMTTSVNSLGEVVSDKYSKNEDFNVILSQIGNQSSKKKSKSQRKRLATTLKTQMEINKDRYVYDMK